MTQDSNPLRINIGNIIHEEVGYFRVYDFERPKLHLPPDLHLLNTSGTVRFSRTRQGLLAQVQFSAHQNDECSRCLKDIDLNLRVEFTELYAFDKRSITESGLVVPDNRMIDLSPLVREYLLLEIPINSLCKTDCLGLCPTCGKNLNKSPHTHKEDKIDPRFAVLKDLLEKDDK